MKTQLFQLLIRVCVWKGEFSDAIEEKQGIKQGETSCYKAGKNHLLNKLDISPSLHIGSISAGALMVADDLAIASRNPHDMQAALYTAEMDASRERYKFNTDKTKTLAINYKQQPTLILNNKPLTISSKEVHLGIHRTSDGKNKATIEDRINSARNACYAMRDAGLHGLNGAGPEIAMAQYAHYVLPTLLYGLEALVIKGDCLEELEKYHRKNLRYIQHLPQSTATPAIYLLLGALPIEAHLDIRTLTLYRSIISHKQNNPPADYIREIIYRQLITTSDDSSSWTRHVAHILAKYNLPSAYQMFVDPPKKAAWKRTVDRVVKQEWTRRLQGDAELKPSLEYLNPSSCHLGHTHRIWKHINCDLDIKKATVKASFPTSGNKSELCPLCKTENETTTHFLLHCPSTRQARLPYLKQIFLTCQNSKITIEPSEITQLILDPTELMDVDKEELEKLTRNMVFKLHHKRGLLLGGGSAYSCKGLARIS